MTVPTRREIAATFDEIADEFDASRQAPWPETVSFERELAPNSLVLDVGCGGGRNLAFLKGRGHRVVGLDVSPRLLKNSAAKVGRTSLVHGDAVALPFSPAKFGAVHSVAVVHHLPSEEERRESVREIARVLRPRGTALLSAWALEQDRFQSQSGADRLVPWRQSDGRTVERFYHLFRAAELEALATPELAVVRAWREGDNHVLLAAKR